MTKNKLTITGIQADLSWHNPEKNRMYFAQQIKNLSANTDLIVLPEMFTTGFTMYPEQICKNEQQRTVNWLVELSATHNTAICGSIITSKDDAFFNTFYFVQPCGTINTYIKRHSFTLAGEDKAYTAGNTKTIITYKGWRICPLICYDLRFPVWARNTENYDVLLYVANWPETRIKAWKTLLKARAIENMCYVVGVNRVGTDNNNYSYSGNSLIIDYLGHAMAKLKKDTAGIITTNLDKARLDNTREKLGFLIDKDYFRIL